MRELSLREQQVVSGSHFNLNVYFDPLAFISPPIYYSYPVYEPITVITPIYNHWGQVIGEQYDSYYPEPTYYPHPHYYY